MGSFEPFYLFAKLNDFFNTRVNNLKFVSNKIPAQEGETIHLWLFFADKQHKKISPTVYLNLLNDHP